MAVSPNEPLITASKNGVSGLANFSFHHSQGVASAEWYIEHSLGFYPNVTTVDSAGTTAEGEVEYIDRDTIRVTFSAPFSGDAFLS
jgi:hypothetical protein